ncbi:hypothetical protein [Methylobacterium tarhaniae]|nr:hypothetical protein [Methylobacterium tarhaniae]
MVATEHGIYCSKHSAAKRRHGHPDQKGITKHDLKTYLGIVHEKRKKHEGKLAWIKMEEKWRDLVAIANGVIARANEGRAMNRYKRLAAIEIRKLADHVDPSEIIDTVLAMYLMQELEGRRFRSDNAFWTQLVRRVRGLTTLNAGVRIDPDTRKKRTTYSELPPKSTLAIASYLRSALGSAGVFIAQMVRDDREREEAERRSYFEALTELA